MEILSYGLKFDNISTHWITVDATSFNDDGEALSWAIRNGTRSCYSKSQKRFIYEPMPSERDDDFFSDCRFLSAIEAETFFNNHNN